MRAPTDVVLSGPDRNFADMMHYLRWEEALGTKVRLLRRLVRVPYPRQSSWFLCLSCLCYALRCSS